MATLGADLEDMVRSALVKATNRGGLEDRRGDMAGWRAALLIPVN